MPITGEIKTVGERKKRETREVLDIVFDMLSSDVPESQIMQMLLQLGLASDEAGQVLNASKLRYKEYMDSRMAGSIEKVFTTKRKELLEQVAASMKDVQKQMQLQNDLRLLETQKYADRKSEEVLTQVTALKSDVFNVRSETDARFTDLQSKIAGIEVQTTPHVQTVLTMAVGALIAFVPLVLIRDGLSKTPFSFAEFLPNLMVYLIIMVVGGIIAKHGYDGYSQRHSSQLKSAVQEQAFRPGR